MLSSPRKCSPNRMMTTPEAIASSALYCPMNWPNAEAPAPSATNTVVNPITKNTDASTVRSHTSRAMPFSPVICSIEVPPR